MLNGPLYGSLPATQAWIRNSRFARSCRLLCPTGSRTGRSPGSRGLHYIRHGASRRCGSHRPAPMPSRSASCRQRWPDPAHLRGKRGGPPTCPAQAVDQRGSAKAMRYWPTGGDRRRRCRCGLSASFLFSSFAHLPSPPPRLRPHHRDGLDPNEVRTIILGAQRQDRL